MAVSPVISTREVAVLLASSTPPHVVDGSMFPGEDCKAKFLEGHIPTAVFFDQDVIRAKNSSHSLALLSASSFAEHMKNLGLPNDGSLIVVYDQYSLISGARVWFLLKYYGYPAVTFLDGGLPKWIEEGRPLSTGPAPPAEEFDPSLFQLTLHPDMVAHLDEVKTTVAALQNRAPGPQIWDPRNSAKVGSTIVPGSTCFFFRNLLEFDGTFKRPEQMREVLAKAGIDLNRPVITSCNRGVVSSAGYLMLYLLGKTDVKNYLGSWIEWKVKVVDVESQPAAV